MKRFHGPPERDPRTRSKTTKSQAVAVECRDLRFLERTTGFEPATSTLARLRSTN